MEPDCGTGSNRCTRLVLPHLPGSWGFCGNKVQIKIGVSASLIPSGCCPTAELGSQLPLTGPSPVQRTGCGFVSACSSQRPRGLPPAGDPVSCHRHPHRNTPRLASQAWVQSLLLHLPSHHCLASLSLNFLICKVRVMMVLS